MVRYAGIIALLMTVGCTALERQDVYRDLAAGLPKIAEDTATGGPVGAIVGGITVLGTVLSGWLVRKYWQKKYAAAKLEQ